MANRQHEDRQHTAELYDKLSESYFEVSVQYVLTTWDEPHAYGDATAYSHEAEVSIESYELEGVNISREELVTRFGEDEVRKLEEL